MTQHTPIEPTPPHPEQVPIVTHLDLAHVFGLLLHLYDQTPGEQLLDPDSHNALALVESIVTRQPSSGPDCWSVYVGPFAVQAPAPMLGGETR